jgi:hypothetical protein
MATINRNRLKQLLTQLPPGAPITSEQLAELGISADLAVHYVRAGWLERLARGVFLRPADTLLLHPALRMLEQRISGLHVGGKTALDWHGIRHFVRPHSTLHLYGWVAGRLPEWFQQRFPSDYHRKRLFDENATSMLHVARFQNDRAAPLVSSPERALLELFSEIGVRESVSEARELIEGTNTLRARVLKELLQKCTSVKTVRLCLTLGTELSLPWAQKLNPAELPTGSDKPWVSRRSHGTLILKP